jgi:hypothetical protein
MISLKKREYLLDFSESITYPSILNLPAWDGVENYPEIDIDRDKIQNQLGRCVKFYFQNDGFAIDIGNQTFPFNQDSLKNLLQVGQDRIIK